LVVQEEKKEQPTETPKEKVAEATTIPSTTSTIAATVAATTSAVTNTTAAAAPFTLSAFGTQQQGATATSTAPLFGSMKPNVPTAGMFSLNQTPANVNPFSAMAASQNKQNR
jgi:hypothetical protein